MIGRNWVVPCIVLAFFLVTAACHAQSVGPDEAVGAHGAVTQKLALTSAQKSAIYNAMLQQRVRASTTRIEPTVGAPVSPSIALSELPNQTGIDGAIFLKYAMVEDDVVVVDPIEMRVVEIIHGSTSP
jgi:hypothetical protein